MRVQTGPGDSDQPAAFGEPGKCRADMLEGSVPHPTLDPGGNRERWVHQHDAGSNGVRKPIVDLRRIVARHGLRWEQPIQQVGAIGREFIQRQRRRAGYIDREQPGAGRWLHHDVAVDDAGRQGRDVSQADRRRELLKPLALLGALRLRRQEGRNAIEHRERGRRAGRSPSHRCSIAAQEEHLGNLAGLIGVAPQPGARRIGAVECSRHNAAEALGRDRLSAREMRLDQVRDGDDQGRLRSSWGCGAGLGGNKRPRCGEGSMHDVTSGRAGEGDPPFALSRPGRATPSRPSSHSGSVMNAGGLG